VRTSLLPVLDWIESTWDLAMCCFVILFVILFAIAIESVSQSVS
jgi:hypothetical protein